MDWQRRTWGSTFALPKAKLGFQVVMQWLMLEVRNELNGGERFALVQSAEGAVQ